MALNDLLLDLGFTCAKAYHIDAAHAVLQNHIDGELPAQEKSVVVSETKAEVDSTKSLKKVVVVDEAAASSGGDTANGEGEVKGETKGEIRKNRKERVASARAKGKVTVPPAKAGRKLTVPSQPTSSTEELFKGFEAESFDAILLDPPCSALGLRSLTLCRLVTC